jgi:hypothetical protein
MTDQIVGVVAFLVGATVLFGLCWMIDRHDLRARRSLDERARRVRRYRGTP